MPEIRQIRKVQDLQLGKGLADVSDLIQFFGFDGNVFAFSIAAAVQIAATVLAWRE